MPFSVFFFLSCPYRLMERRMKLAPPVANNLYLQLPANIPIFWTTGQIRIFASKTKGQRQSVGGFERGGSAPSSHPVSHFEQTHQRSGMVHIFNFA